MNVFTEALVSPFKSSVKLTTNPTKANAKASLNSSFLKEDTFKAAPPGKTPYGDMLGAVLGEQQDYYDSTYRPLAKQLIADVDSTDIVDNAKKNAENNVAGTGMARTARQKARLGVSGDPSSSVLGQYDSSLNTAAANDGNINYSRQMQQDRNDAARSDLVAISRGISQDAIGGLEASSQTESNRAAANSNIAAQNKSAQIQTGGTIASLAMMAYMLF